MSRDAETDLTLIWVYLAEQNRSAADRLREKFDSQFERILEFPRIGRVRDDVDENCRSFGVGSYIVFYREIENGVEVTRVLHGAQDIHAILSPENPDHT